MVLEPDSVGWVLLNFVGGAPSDGALQTMAATIAVDSRERRRLKLQFDDVMLVALC